MLENHRQPSLLVVMILCQLVYFVGTLGITVYIFSVITFETIYSCLLNVVTENKMIVLPSTYFG